MWPHTALYTHQSLWESTHAIKCPHVTMGYYSNQRRSGVNWARGKSNYSEWDQWAGLLKLLPWLQKVPADCWGVLVDKWFEWCCQMLTWLLITWISTSQLTNEPWRLSTAWCRLWTTFQASSGNTKRWCQSTADGGVIAALLWQPDVSRGYKWCEVWLVLLTRIFESRSVKCPKNVWLIFWWEITSLTTFDRIFGFGSVNHLLHNSYIGSAG